MYENSEAELDRILRLVAKCPEPLREKAFEILLDGYVRTVGSAIAPMSSPPAGLQPPSGAVPPPSPPDGLEASIPAEVQSRLQAIAKRKNVPATELAGIFDFSTDPFVFAPIHVSGKGNADRTRAARSFSHRLGGSPTGRKSRQLKGYQEMGKLLAALQKHEAKLNGTVSDSAVAVA
jgi:hypothetical protein